MQYKYILVAGTQIFESVFFNTNSEKKVHMGSQFSISLTKY